MNVLPGKNPHQYAWQEIAVKKNLICYTFIEIIKSCAQKKKRQSIGGKMPEIAMQDRREKNA